MSNSPRTALAAIAVLSFVLPLRSPRAQAADRPVAFDRAGSVNTITHTLAERLGLRPPGWRVQGDYRDVRAFAGDSGVVVLVVQRLDGTMERLPLTSDQFESLRLEVDTRLGVLARGGAAAPPGTTAPPLSAPAKARPLDVADVARREGTPASPAYAYRPDAPSKPAGTDFARNQLVLAGVVYGPLAAALVEETPSAIAIYMAIAASTYFATVKPSREGLFTEAQNRLATGLAVGGAMAGGGLSFALGLGNPNERLLKDKATLGMALAGAIGGAVAGTVLAKRMTDGEAEGTSFGAGAGLVIASGLAAAAKGESARSDARLIGGVAVLGMAGGAVLGNWYATNAPYTLTVGDVIGMSGPGLVGILAGLTIARPNTASSVSVTAGLATAGLAAGLVAGDWFFARRFDLTERQGYGLLGGAIVGGALLAGPFLLGETKDSGVLFGAATAGSLLGVWGVTQLSALAPGTMRSVSPGGGRGGRGGAGGGRGRASVELMPANLAFAAAGLPGRFPLVHVRF